MPECDICHDTGIVTGRASGYCRCRFGNTRLELAYPPKNQTVHNFVERWFKILGYDTTVQPDMANQMEDEINAIIKHDS